MRVIWHRVVLTRHSEPFNKRDRGRRAERRFREEHRGDNMEHEQPARADCSYPDYRWWRPPDSMDTGGIAELVQLLRR